MEGIILLCLILDFKFEETEGSLKLKRSLAKIMNKGLDAFFMDEGI